MTVKALMPVRNLNLVVPLAHKATAMRTTGTSALSRALPGAVSTLIDPEGLRGGDVDSTNVAPTPGTRTSTTATRTTTTRAMRAEPEPSADPDLFARLVQAYIDCRRTKRNSPSAQAFEAHLERNLISLHDELAGGTYRPGRSVCFVITRPKPREVWAAGFRDRVVHHLLYNHIGPAFEARFIANSCACIPGRGTLYAARRLEGSIRSITQNWSQPASYLKLDLANFFVAIDKRVLDRQLAAGIGQAWWLALARTVLHHDPRTSVDVRGTRQELASIPPHKSLFNAPTHAGLPIGNLSSQFFANVYLNELDQHIKHHLKVSHYLRYVDDMVLLHRDPAWLHQARLHIEQWLPENLGAQLNPVKTILQPVDRGVDFVGQVIKPWCRSTRRRTVAEAMRQVRCRSAEDLPATANSYFGLLRQASHSHADRCRLANTVRRQGHCVDGRLTKAIPKGSA